MEWDSVHSALYTVDSGFQFTRNIQFGKKTPSDCGFIGVHVFVIAAVIM